MEKEDIKKMKTTELIDIIDKVDDVDLEMAWDEIMRREPFYFIQKELIKSLEDEIKELKKEIKKLKTHDHINGKIVIPME
jgi:cob(I)alamin adenosyltransferase